MKKFSRIFVVLMALILVAAMVPAANAAGTAPGEKASVSFTYKDIYGIDGEFTFSNPAIISGSVTYTSNTTMSGSVENDQAYFYNSDKADITITVSFTVSASANDGDKCEVSFKYETSDKQGNMSGWDTDKQTVVVEIPEETTEPEQTQPEQTDPEQTEPEQTEPKPTEPKPQKPGAVDYTELNNQIAAAKALKEEEYTADSWAALQDALAKAEEALKSKDQKVVDAAAEALAEAIKNLKKLDYTALIEAIEKTEDFLAGDLLGGKGTALVEALQNAKALLNNAKDQESIDKAAEALMNALTELMEVLEQLANKPADKEPTGEFCNISIHYVWPVLFFVSLAVNAVLVILYIRRKKKEEAAE